MTRAAIARLRHHPRIELLGNPDAPRLAVLSFLVRGSDGRHLHPRLVARLLNDLFGIQLRAGCACAGPYAHRLPGIAPLVARTGRAHASAPAPSSEGAPASHRHCLARAQNLLAALPEPASAPVLRCRPPALPEALVSFGH